MVIISYKVVIPMKIIVAVLLSLVSLCKCTLDQYISNKTNIINSLVINDNHHHHHELEQHLSIFLLSTFNNAQEVDIYNDNFKFDFFSRIIASKLTWGRRIDEFYMVTGDGDIERKVLRNHSICTNHTSDYINGELITQKRGNMEVYKCLDLQVLHIPFCNNHNADPNGLCCRCNAAMNFYLNKILVDERVPQWFIFSDDDFYIRTDYVQSVLHHMKYKYSQHKDTPYIIIPFGNNPSKGGWDMSPTEYEVLPIGNNQSKKYTQYCLYNASCYNTCAHRCIMSAIGGFNKHAIMKLQDSIRNYDLLDMCIEWKCSHDVGLGMYFYFTQFKAIPLVSDDTYYHLFHSRLFTENTDIKYDNIITKYIWNDLLKMNHTFNYHEYIQLEIEKGKQYSKETDLYEIDGFHSTSLYNKHMNESLSYYTHHYNSSECYNDRMIFEKWITFINKYDAKHPTNYLEMCTEYQQHVETITSL